MNARFALCGLLVLLGSSANAQRPAANSIQIAGNPVELRMGFVGDGIARLQLLPIDAEGNVTESADMPHLVPQAWRGEPVRTRELPAQAIIHQQGNVRLAFNPANWTVRMEMVADVPGQDGSAMLPSQRLQIDPETGRISFRMVAPVFGLGEGGKPHDRRGAVNRQEVGGWNNPDYPLNDWVEHLGIPWLVSPSGWGIYLHSPAGMFDLAGDEGVFTPRAPGRRGRGRTGRRTGRRGAGRRGAGGGTTQPAQPQPIDVFFVVAREPAGLMRAWAEITGYPSLPPLWSLGYIQSHRGIEGPEQVMEIARTFRERNLPCDMLIYLGTGFTPDGWNTGHGEFEFREDKFPDPEAILQQLKDLHFRVALHVTTRGRESPGRQLAGRVADDPPAEPRDQNVVANYWALHAQLMKLGVDAWWPDEGEGWPAATRLTRIQMYWEGPQQLDPDRRPFALHRTGAVGMQRYGGWLWSGDVKSNWDVLARHVPLGLNVVVGGTPYWGSDTGGFYQDRGRELDGELFARWFQFSAFCPLFRSHGRDWRYRHLPWGFSDIEGPERDPRIEPICKRYLDLRYQLMPYTYSAFYEAHEMGMPIMRPLWLHYPNDAAAVARGDEYLWGRDLLVAPVVERGATERSLYLPPGRWYDYWTGETVEGGREITRPVDLETMPLYARAGAIIPLGPKENYTLEKPNDPLVVHVYTGADGRFTLIEDDGLTFSSLPMRVEFTWDDDRRALHIALEPGSQMRAPTTRQIEVRMIGDDEDAAAKTVEFTGEPIEIAF